MGDGDRRGTRVDNLIQQSDNPGQAASAQAGSMHPINNEIIIQLYIKPYVHCYSCIRFDYLNSHHYDRVASPTLLYDTVLACPTNHMISTPRERRFCGGALVAATRVASLQELHLMVRTTRSESFHIVS